jgi:hypothetical protein
MNKLINLIINTSHQSGFQNIHINEINNIPDYSVDMLRFAELNTLNYALCENVILQLLNKIRPETGICIVEITDMFAVCLSYANKMISTEDMSKIIAITNNTFGLSDIKSLIDKQNNLFTINKITNNNNTISIAIQRNSI